MKGSKADTTGFTTAHPARAAYDRLAAVYDRRWQKYVRSTLEPLAAALDFRGGESVLDVGCGTGELERLLIERWPALRLVGSDLSHAMLRKACEKDLPQSVACVQAEVCRLPFPDGRFDHVVCANSFHYFRRPADALREIRRVIRPGGRLTVVDWCDDYLACKLCSVWLRFADPAFHRTYSLKACSRLLDRAGFRTTGAHRFRADWLWGLMQFTCRCGS